MTWTSWSAEDEATLRRMFDAGAVDAEIALALGRSTKSVTSRRSVLKLRLSAQINVRPLPADWAEAAPGATNAELRLRYSTHNNIINRWRSETGIAQPPPRKMPPSSRPATAAPKRFSKSSFIATGNRAPDVPRPSSIFDRAADHLRSPRGGGWYVYRCTGEGKTDPKGDHWRVGQMVLAPADMIEMSKRKGFDAVEWQRIAA